jgi:ribonuclease R
VLGQPDGFGFLRPDEGGDDLFLSPREMRVLLHGDRIVATVKSVDRRGRREGSVVEVLERNTTQVVGRFHREHGLGFVRPDNKRIHLDVVVPPEDQGDAEEGQIVVVDLVEQPSKRSQPIGRVAAVLGDHMAPGMEIDVAIRSNGIPDEWPEAVLEEIRAFGEEVPEDAKAGRVDLRTLPLLTIDGEDARDFDDAVYCRRTPKGWRLVVAIADVSAYVRPGTALDAEAQRRGNSVYFPGRVVPMLPEILSNGLCSLNPDVDRLCMACDMYLNGEGQVIRARFVEGVMRSRARLTYTEVAQVVGDGDDSRPGGAAWTHAPLLRELHELFTLLLTSRSARGAIDLDTVETRIVFGEGKKIERIEPVRRNDAHRLIEECMLAANVTTARHLQRKRLPFLYRVHERPVQEKVHDLRTFLGELGLSLGGGDEPQPGDYGVLLNTVRDRPDFSLIQTVVLRSLSQAVYSPERDGHFGLAYDAYAHFTSPIRRYPDLLVHRALRHVARGGRADTFAYSQPDLLSLGEHCSMTERRADEATRDAEAWLKCEYVMDRIGEEFDGIVTGVTSFGMFVELEDIYVEGLVHITNLPRDYYHFDPVGHRLVGDKGGLSYRLADRVRVLVAAVNLDERKLDFELVEARRRSGRGAQRAATRRSRR